MRHTMKLVFYSFRRFYSRWLWCPDRRRFFFRYNFNAVVFQDVPSEFGMHQHLFLFLLQNENKIEDFNLALAKQHTYSNRKEFKYFTQRLTLNLFILHTLQHC